MTPGEATTTGRSTSGEPTTADESTTEESTTTENAPGYKNDHWHGRLFFEVNGALVDFHRPKYYLKNIEDDHPDAVYFHFHETAHGPNEWSNEKKVITFARALNLLPGISYSKDGSGNHVITYDGTTYRASDSGTEIDISVGTRRIDPTEHEVRHDDNFWVRIDTGKSTAPPAAEGTRTGKLVFDVNNRRLNFAANEYLRAGTRRFEFRDDGRPYTWYNEGDPIAVATALDTLPTVEYSAGSGGGHVITYDVDGPFGGTYRSSDAGTKIIVRQRTTDLRPTDYRLKQGDIVWVYVHTDRAPDNEH